MTNVIILSIFRKHVQKEYRKVLEMSISIPKILALLLFKILQCIHSKSGQNGTQDKYVK